MGRPHRFASSRLSARTTLPRERVLELGAAAATVAVGNRWEGRTETHHVGSTASGDAYEIKGGLGARHKHADFRLAVVEAGGLRDVSTEITWYRTMQSVVYGFIPMGRKTMLGHHAYLQYVENLAERLRLEDPSATIAVYKGAQVLVTSGGAGGVAPAPASASAPPSTPAPWSASAPPTPVAPAPPSAGPPPPPGGRACAACTAVAHDEDVYCGQCGTALPTTTASPAPGAVG